MACAHLSTITCPECSNMMRNLRDEPKVIFGTPYTMQRLDDQAARITALEADLAAHREALRELVTLKAIHDEPEPPSFTGAKTPDRLARLDRQSDYIRRKPIAWANARRLLGEG